MATKLERHSPLDIYEFDVPHITGGNAHITIEVWRILRFMNDLKETSTTYQASNDDDLIDEFISQTQAYKRKNNE